MDFGEQKYGKNFIDDVKALGNVIYMFLPFPIFWALFDQQVYISGMDSIKPDLNLLNSDQGSRWTFQATRMNGETFGATILPDQMQVVNPLLILGFIPIFDYIIYPLLAKCNIFKTPLQRIVGGGVLAGLSFVVSGVLELQLEVGFQFKLIKSWRVIK